MNKILLISTVIIVILLTLIAGIQKPELNKPVSFDSGEIKAKLREMPVENASVNINPVAETQTEIKVTSVQSKTVEQPIKVSQVKTPKTSTNNKISTVQQPKTAQKSEPQAVKKPLQTTQSQPAQTKKKVLTEQEEIIAWNAWRSHIQNTVMQRFQTAAPVGAKFKFSFTVDKWGRISNLSVGCANSLCPSYATERIRAVITGFQNTSILNFPEGTSRIMTVVKGGFEVTSSESQFSKPSDYSDYELIKRQVER